MTRNGISTLTQVNATRLKRVKSPTARLRNVSMRSALRNLMALTRCSAVGAAWRSACIIGCQKTTAVRDKSRERFAYKTPNFLTKKRSHNPHLQFTLICYTLGAVYQFNSKNLKFRL